MTGIVTDFAVSVYIVCAEIPKAALSYVQLLINRAKMYWNLKIGIN